MSEKVPISDIYEISDRCPSRRTADTVHLLLLVVVVHLLLLLLVVVVHLLLGVVVEAVVSKAVIRHSQRSCTLRTWRPASSRKALS